MKTEKIRLSQLKVNKDNPRTITKRKLDLLVQRLLAFPKMIELRPVVIEESNVSLGGNMRLQAFNIIAGMTIEQIAEILAGTKNFQRLTKAEKGKLLAYWQAWLEDPKVDAARADTLSEEEKKEFIIADNASFGEWNFDKLANEWDNDDLVNWGLDVWQPEPPQPSAGRSSGSGEAQPFDPSNLPAELQGQDINPDDLPKVEGSNETAMDRVIIVYPKDKAEEVAAMLGIEKIDKVVYNLAELTKDGQDESEEQ
jgi:hypothetical protein